jgi:hypothetical protein
MYSTALSRNKKYTKLAVSKEPTNCGSLSHLLSNCLVRRVEPEPPARLREMAGSSPEKSMGLPMK